MRFQLTILAVILTATPAIAQQGMTPEMQQMMKNMQKNMGQIQQCMAQVDQKAIEKLQVKTKQMESEVKRLCAAGQRDEAQDTAIRFGLELSKDPELQKMRKCGEELKGMPMPGEFFPKGGQNDVSSKHICDI
jgi:dsDNA-specific endonuclease/ATPase MutS2